MAKFDKRLDPRTVTTCEMMPELQDLDADVDKSKEKSGPDDQEMEVEQTVEEAKQEAADLMEALQRSKSENQQQPLNAAGVLLLRLSRMARSPKIVELFHHSPCLEHCRTRMAEAGLPICPSWTEAKMLVPLFPEDFDEAGIELHYDNVVALAADMESIREALRSLGGSGKHRPQLKVADSRVKRPRVEEMVEQTPYPTSTMTEQPLTQEEPESDSEAPIEVAIVSSFAPRTSSSVGMPANPYFSR